MSLINLSKEYIRNCNPPFYERIRMVFDLDLYLASSLLAIEEHFRQSPPKRRKKWSSYPSAWVLMRGLEIKRMHPDSFEEEDGVSLQGLDDGLTFPMFEIRDHTMRRFAPWGAGNSSKYVKAQEEFGFNRESYVSIPKVFLQYGHDNKRGWLLIKALALDRRPQTEKKSLKDKILELVPEFSTPIPQPSDVL